MEDKEIIFRKTFLKNTYNMSKYLPNLLNYEEFKKMILLDLFCNHRYCLIIKNYYNCLYLIVDSKNIKICDFVLELCKNIFGEKYINFDYSKVDYSKIDKIISSLTFMESYDCYIFICIILQYIAFYKTEKIYRFSNLFYKKLNKLLLNGNYIEIEKLLDNEIKQNNTPDFQYYESIRTIQTDEIIEYIVENQMTFKNDLKINVLYLSGSFVKNCQRIDSDIDFICVFKDGLSYKEKQENVLLFKKMILNTFDRYGDLLEFNNSILENELYKKIY